MSEIPVHQSQCLRNALALLLITACSITSHALAQQADEAREVDVDDALADCVAISRIGNVAYFTADFDTAQAKYEEVLALCAKAGIPPNDADVLLAKTMLERIRDASVKSPGKVQAHRLGFSVGRSVDSQLGWLSKTDTPSSETIVSIRNGSQCVGAILSQAYSPEELSVFTGEPCLSSIAYLVACDWMHLEETATRYANVCKRGDVLSSHATALGMRAIALREQQKDFDEQVRCLTLAYDVLKTHERPTRFRFMKEQTLSLLGESYYQHGDVQKADEICEQLYKVLPAKNESGPLLALWTRSWCDYHMARRLHEQGRDKEAIDYASRAVGGARLYGHAAFSKPIALQRRSELAAKIARNLGMPTYASMCEEEAREIAECLEEAREALKEPYVYQPGDEKQWLPKDWQAAR